MAEGKRVSRIYKIENNKTYVDLSNSGLTEELVVYNGQLIPESRTREKGVDTNSGKR